MPDAQVNGFRMYYEDEGSGEPVILHHGFMGRHDHWTPIVERLGSGRRYIALDCRGAGASEAPPDGYTMRQFALDTLALADHLGIDRFTFVGWSLGGGVGWQLGLNHANRLDKLVLVAPAPADTPAFLAAQERGDVDPGLLDTVGAIAEASGSGDRTRLERAARHLFLRQPDGVLFARLVEGMGEARPEHIGFFADVETNAAIDGSEDLTLLYTPTLMLAGAHDSLASTNIAEYQRLPNATLHVFSGAGHMFPHEVPDATSEAMEDFLVHGVRQYAPLPAELKPAPA